MKSTNQSTPIEVFAGNNWQAELLKTMLKDADIQAYVIGENIGSIAPWYTSGGVCAVKVVVASDDYDRAMEIVKEYEENK